MGKADSSENQVDAVVSQPRCEGRRKPGVFQFGPAIWVQCSEDAIVMITVKQEKKATFSACKHCWQTAIDRDMKILKVVSIEEAG